MNRKYFLTLAILAMLLSACSFSLAADVTPPPGNSLPEEVPTQPVPASNPTSPDGAATPTPAGVVELTTTPVLTTTTVVTATQVTGTITGTVTNASGGEVPAGIEVILHSFNQMQTVFTQTTDIKPDGTFAFPNIEMQPGLYFLATVDYKGITFGSDILPVQAASNTLDLPVMIYETTTETTSLAVDRLHLFFEFIDAKTVRVTELYIVSNNGNKAVIAPEFGQPVLTYKLPEGATNLIFQDGEIGGRYQATQDGFADTNSISPGSGSYQVLFAFEMPYNKKLELDQPVSLPVNAVVVLLPAGSVKVKGEGLQDGGTRDVQGVQYQLLNGKSLAIGETLHLTITGNPGTSQSTLSVGSKTNILIGLGGLGVALILAGVWLFLRNRAAASETILEDEIIPTPELNPENAETVMDAILALDDLYKEGKLPEQAYQQRRAELKAHLSDLRSRTS